MNLPSGRPVFHDLLPSMARVGDELHGLVGAAPALCIPGTETVRTSVLALWCDTLAGRLAVDLVGPRVPVTLELDVHFVAAPMVDDAITIVAKPIKIGRSVNVLSVEFAAGNELIAAGGASFMVAPDPGLVMDAERLRQAEQEWEGARGDRSSVSLAQRVGCERRGPGVAALPRSDGVVNASNTINGGLLALVVEEALLSTSPTSTVTSLALRYLRPVRSGPAVATARIDRPLGRVEVRDAGMDNRLAVLATARLSENP